MQGEEQEELARRAKRALWIFRLTFYPAAIAIAVALLAARGDDGPPPLKTYTGWTTQGFRFYLGVRDDRPVFVDTTVTGRCAEGGTWNFHYATSDDPDAIDRDGDRLRAGYEGPWSYGSFSSQVELSIDATLADDELRGRVEYRERFSNGTECASEGVRVTVQR